MQTTDGSELNQQDMHLQPSDAPSPHHEPRRKSRSKLLFILPIIAIVLAAAGFAVWKFVLNKPADNKPAAQAAPVEKVDPVTRDVPDAAGTETFDSPGLAMKLTYPSTWKVSETADNGVRIESQAFTYKGISTSEIKGNFRIYIRLGARQADSTIIGRGYAIAASEKLVYTKPAAGQRAETLITPFGLDEPNNFAYFMIAGNFQLNKGDTLGPNYAKEADAYVIAGGYSSSSLTADLATNEVPADYYATTKAYKQALDILKSIQVH